jgi:flagellar FliJ protein
VKAYSYRFENVLMFREQEKTETEVHYKVSVEEFETVATELYESLKKKEDVIEEQSTRMKTGFSINEIHHYALFIASLEKKIEVLQQKVVQARSKMNWFEEKLLERTIEVRKFEKMKEKDREQHRVETEYREAVRLDEISTLRFRRRENG